MQSSSRSCAARRLVSWSFSALLAGVAQCALAVPVTYQFSTDDTPFGPNTDVVNALMGASVSGTFDYDSEAPLLLAGPNGLNVFAAISNLQGSVAGHSFADPTGLAFLNNDGFEPPVLPPGFDPADFPSDFLQLSVNGPLAPPDFSGFDLLGYTLFNVRMFWIESYAPVDTPDFLSSGDLPAQLPTFSGRLAFDFIVEGEELNFAHSVFFDGFTVAPVQVPEPATISLLCAGLLGFTAVRRRRTNAGER